MLKTIDRYILFRFLKVFVFVVLIFSLISVAIDLSEKVSKLMETGLGVWEIINRYFVGFVMFISSTVWPLYILITCIFFASRLGKNNEIISILNGGVSFWRLLRPFMIGSVLLATVHLIGNHFIIPIADGKRVTFENEELKKRNIKTKNYNIHQMLSPTTKIYIRSYNRDDSIAYDVRIEEFVQTGIKSICSIKKMKFKGDPYLWEIDNYYVRHFDGDHERLENHLFQKKDTTLRIHPRDFVEIKNEERGFTTPQLMERIRIEKLKGTGRERILSADLHRRTADAVMDIILTLLAVSIASRKTRGGVGRNLAVGISLGAGFILLSRMTKFIALGSQLPVAIGIWLPNMIFFVLALYFLANAQK